MNKVIRTARILDERIRLTEFLQEDELAGETGFEELDAVNPEDATEEDPEEVAEELPEEPVEEEPAEVEEIETVSAVEIEKQIEERLKEFEERFQTEKEQAYQSGYEDGKAEGLKEGQEQSGEEIERFKSVIESLTAQWQDHLKNTDHDLMELALAIARRIVGTEVEIHPEPVLRAVRDCLDYLQDKSRVAIRVNPADLEVVREHRNDWLESLEGIDQLLIDGDPGISLGGCIVESAKGDVDAQVEERLEKLKHALEDAIRQGAPETDEPGTSDPES